MRPLSGSGARGLVIETMKTLGPDSFAGRLACVIQGSTETTFYVLAVYFGSVGIRNTRHALACGLAAELAGFVGAVPSATCSSVRLRGSRQRRHRPRAVRGLPRARGSASGRAEAALAASRVVERLSRGEHGALHALDERPARCGRPRAMGNASAPWFTSTTCTSPR